MTTIAQTLKLAALFCALGLFGASAALAQDLMSSFAVMEPGMFGVMEPVSGEGNGHPGGVKNACFWLSLQPGIGSRLG
ncbi:MAG TPA: hypothetical protein VNE59_04420, partial [Burkholderiales bacterium]|nr:hypothetical protein [Burkholderiales bacterium]